ncbi:hypothetical protein [Anthocerotibacter panamensis]|uniref:hypothetical protein n=1 Tax=Anthocerotibacter panamensis TaxID=2857077 RepID=UPI001C407490|nr:hypothetical protein [Anthocerotibacter panamensis]
MFNSWLPLICSFVLWSVLIYLLWDALSWIRQVKRSVQRNLAVPCHRCRYANPDFNYLKCTVHPYAAFTQEATNCSDFSTQEDRSGQAPGSWK